MLFKSAIRLSGALKQRAFERATRDPRGAQAALLADILQRNRETEYGREHHFAGIDTPRAFAEAVPANSFEALSPYVERMKQGEQNVLTSDALVMFSVTSGTTTAPKYVPMTKRGLTLVARRSHQWLYRALRDHPAFLDGSTLCISGAAIEGRTASGVPFGSASGMMYESLPRVLHRTFALPFALSAIEDCDLRYYAMARFAIERDVSFLVTPNPTTMIRLAETFVQHQERIIRSIHDGVVGGAGLFGMDGDDSRNLDTVEPRLRPNPTRAADLEEVMQQHGKLLPSACWDLKLIGCWLGGSIGFQADRLALYFGDDVPKRDIGYLASEGCMTIPYEDNTPAGILALPNNYYEFVPVEEESERGKALQSHELEVGRQYRVLLTNYNGLYRYDIDDIVEVCGFYNSTPVIAFVRKGEDILNITGEKLHVNHFIHAFGRLKQDAGIVVRQFKVVPNQKELRYDVLLEFEDDVAPGVLQVSVLPEIDRYLAEANIEYAAKRNSSRLNAPRLHVMEGAWTESVRASFAAARRRDVQYKWRPFASEVSHVDARHIRYSVTAAGSDDA
jgi:hypothetical protein